MNAMPITHQWARKPLRELVAINYGRDPSDILDADGRYPVYGTSGSERFGTDYLYDGNSIVLGRKGTIERVHFVTGRFWTIDTAYFLSDFRDAFPKWLFYFLTSVDLRSLNEATGVPSLSRDLLYKIQVPTPPKREQAKIAEVLSTVDRAIEQTEALIAKQQRIKTGLMQDLLTRGIDEHGNLRSELTHKFKDWPLGRIPVDWEVYKLGHLITDHQAGVYKKRELYGEGFNIVGVSDLYRHSSVSGQVFRRVPLTKYEQKHYTLQADDLIYGESSLVLDGIAKILWVTAEGEGTAFAWHTRKLCVKKEMVNSQYLCFAMDSYPVRRRIMSVATQTALTGITTSDVFSVPVPIPKKREQEVVAERLNQIDKVIAQERTKHKKLLKLKTALMQDLLTGKVRVTPLLSEPEEASA